MTWVVGGRHVACARCIADVEVTLEYPNGVTEHGGYVQKVHILSDDVVIAFADRIRLAFAIIDLIKAEFMPRLDERLLDQPEIVAQRLTRFIRYAFNKVKRNGERVEFMLFIRPKRELASYGVWKMVSPKFNRIAPSQPFEMLEIGSGSVASNYRDLIRKGSLGLVEVPGEDGGLPNAVIPVGKVAMQWLFAEALEHQVAGVSHAMQLMMMYSGSTMLHDRSDSPERPFPPVAKSWPELCQNLRARNISVAACSAMA